MGRREAFFSWDRITGVIIMGSLAGLLAYYVPFFQASHFLVKAGVILTGAFLGLFEIVSIGLIIFSIFSVIYDIAIVNDVSELRFYVLGFSLLALIIMLSIGKVTWAQLLNVTQSQIGKRRR